MRYCKLAFQYMANKHFWKLILLVLVPSVAISVFTGLDTIASLISFFPDRTEYTFAELYGLTSELNWYRLIALVVILIVYTVLFAIMIGAMQRHMRTGRFAITNIFKRINEHFLPAFITLLTLFLFMFLFGLCINITILAWWGMTHNFVATYILTILFMIVFYLLLVWLFTIFFLTCPNMVVTGQGLADSISYSVRISRSKKRKLFLAIALPMTILLAIPFGTVWLSTVLPKLAYAIIRVVINSVIILFFSCYYPVLMFVSYYDINDKDREDLLPVNRL